MRFEEAYGGWRTGRLSREEAARRLVGVCERTFRRYLDRYEDAGLEGLIERRLEHVSHRRAPVEEVMALRERYRSRHVGWNVKHCYAWYRREGGRHSYRWVKNTLQGAGLVTKAVKRGVHRKRRERAPWPGMMLHQDGSRHAWVVGQQWDLIVTMDAATSEHYSLFFVPEEGTVSSFQGVREGILSRGLFSSLYTDRASHYWITPEAGGKVDTVNLTQLGRAMKQRGVIDYEKLPSVVTKSFPSCGVSIPQEGRRVEHQDGVVRRIPEPILARDTPLLSYDPWAVIKTLTERGISKKAIARPLGLSVPTVRRYRRQGGRQPYRRARPVGDLLDRQHGESLRRRAPPVNYCAQV